MYWTVAWATFIGLFWFAMPHLLASATNSTPQLRPRPSGALTAPELLAFYLSLVVGLAGHESAHALCARRFGFTVSAVHLGSGPVLLQRKFGEVLVVAHLIPFGGATAWRPGGATATPRKRAAVALAGPLSNLVLAAVCWSARSYAPTIAIPAACANLLTFVDNIMPIPYMGGHSLPNDGWQILKNITNSYWARTHARRLELSERCMELVRAEQLRAASDYVRAEIERMGNDYADGEALLCALLLDPRQSQAAISEGFARSSRLFYDRRAFPGLRAAALNGRAYMIALNGWPSLLPEAEWAAREALRRLPDNLGLLDTLALVLVRRGRFDEAEAIAKKVVRGLTKAMRSAAGPTSMQLTRALSGSRCTLGLLYASTGRADAARRELAEARSLDIAHPLLAQLEQMLQAGTGIALTAQHFARQNDAIGVPQPLPLGADCQTQVGSGTRTPRPEQWVGKAWAVPMLVEVAGGIALIGILVHFIATSHTPASVSSGGVLSFRLDISRVSGDLGALAAVIAAASVAAVLMLRSPTTSGNSMSAACRRAAQCGPFLNLFVLTPVLALIVTLRYARGSSMPSSVEIVLAVAASVILAVDVAAIRLFTAGVLRLRVRELVPLSMLSLFVLIAPGLLVEFFVSRPAAATHLRWNYFWVADDTGMRHQLTGLSCRSAADCVAVITTVDYHSSRQFITLARTTDDGVRWSRKSLPYLHSLRYGGPNDISCTPAASCLVTSGAEQIAFSATGAPSSLTTAEAGDTLVNGLTCPAASACYGLGGDFVKVTHDGGSTWASKTTLPGSMAEEARLSGIACTSATSCAAFGTDGTRELLDVTTDGGVTWTRQRTTSGLEELSSMSCPVSRACYATGDATESIGTKEARPLGVEVLRSDNLGRTWTRLATLPGHWSAAQVSCVVMHCVVLGTRFSSRGTTDEASIRALVTQDGGATWSSYALPYHGEAVAQTLHCLDARHCQLAAETANGPLLVSTSDGGQSWTARAIP